LLRLYSNGAGSEAAATTSDYAVSADLPIYAIIINI